MSGDVILLLIAGVLTGISRIINKTIAVEGASATAFTTVTQLTGAAIALPLLFINFHVSASPKIWLFILISVTAYAFCVALLFLAYKHADISAVSIIERLNVVFVAVLGMVILGEKHSFSSLAGLALICAGGIILIFKKTRLNLSTGIILALLSAAIGSVSAVLDKIVLTDFSPFTYVFINDLLVGSVFLARPGCLRHAPETFAKYRGKILATAFLTQIAFASVLVVLSRTDVSTSIPIYKSFAFITPVFAGITVLGERENLGQKIIGASLAIAGILLV